MTPIIYNNKNEGTTRPNLNSESAHARYVSHGHVTLQNSHPVTETPVGKQVHPPIELDSDDEGRADTLEET